jgi:Oxidoreductase molybdopterin binding domain
MMPPFERRKALPVHPVPTGLATQDAWRLQVDGLVSQPLVLSVSEVEAFGAQARSADFVCDEGWMVPEQQWEGVPVAAILGRAGGPTSSAGGARQPLAAAPILVVACVDTPASGRLPDGRLDLPQRAESPAGGPSPRARELPHDAAPLLERTTVPNVSPLFGSNI